VSEQKQVEFELIEDIASFTHNPYGFVMYAFEWGKGELSDFEGPEQWQVEHLKSIGEKLAQGKTNNYEAILEATASGHGIGKSALVAWLIMWSLSTCEDTRGVVTANTENQLKTKTWAELSKWHRLCITKDWFTLTATAIYSADSAHEKTWRIDMVPWSLQNTEAFAGLHNKGKRIIVIFDEGSAISDMIYEVTEGALTDAETEILWLAYGNPTRNTGRFRECFGKFAHRWKGRHVDSRTVKITNKAQIQKWVDDYGEDSDFVRVRVKGEFPRAGSNQFISAEDVDICKGYKAEGYGELAKVLSVDVARFGDDQNVACIRQGRMVQPLIKWRGVDTMQTSARITELYEKELPDMVFIDGGGVGGGVVDRVKQLIPEKKVREINFGGKPNDPAKYFNKRAEMWGTMRDAIIAGIQLPKDSELVDELCAVEYGFTNKQQIQLEKKDDMKKRGLASPDCADALAMSFAENVMKERSNNWNPENRGMFAGSGGWMG
jgi:hypothetical protein